VVVAAAGLFAVVIMLAAATRGGGAPASSDAVGRRGHMSATSGEAPRIDLAEHASEAVPRDGIIPARVIEPPPPVRTAPPVVEPPDPVRNRPSEQPRGVDGDRPARPAP
jgi:hypothetical protein